MSDVKYDVIEKVGVIAENKGYTKEVRIISWNGGEPKIDIRNWTPNGPGKGISFSREEAEKLAGFLQELLKK